MAGFCLPASEVQTFLRKLKDRTIDPEKLVEMDSEGRRDFFEKHIGKGMGKEINTLFESRMLLKNQQAAYIQWAQQLAGMREPVKRGLIARIEKMDTVLSPMEEKAFLTDLAEQKLGVGVSFEEAKAITDLSNKIKASREAADAGGDRLEYGRALYDLNDYIAERKQNANRLRMQDLKDRPLQTIASAASELPGQSKAMQAAFDDSAIFRQGWKVLFTNPIIWQRNARKSFVDIVRTFGKQNVMRELNADIQSRPNARNGFYDKAKLAVGTTEEAFPTSLPERVPYLGRAYKASENAFTGFVHKTRADVFDKVIDIAKKTGVDLNDTELRNIGRMINSLTGRGHLGHLELVGNEVNNVLFSPRFLKSHMDVLGGHILTGGGGPKILIGKETGSNFVRKQAAQNLVKIIAGTAGTLALAQAVGKAFGKDDVVEWDPRSSDFGKIKIGQTRFDVTGGMGSLVTLAARLLSGSTKKTGTGEVKRLYGKGSRMANGIDVMEDFFENKASPIGQTGLDFLRGENREGRPLRPIADNKLNWLFEATDMFTPLPAKTSAEALKQSDRAPLLAIVLADALGVSANTYTPTKGKVRKHGTSHSTSHGTSRHGISHGTR